MRASSHTNRLRDGTLTRRDRGRQRVTARSGDPFGPIDPSDPIDCIEASA